MYLSRRMEEKFKELFRKGYVKGTVIISIGNEATSVGMSLPFRHGSDIVSVLHRDFGAHLVAGGSPVSLMCQYMANEKSPTHGKEGNVHHGDILARRFPMISHLGDMLAPAVGGVWAARRNGENVLGLASIGDGGSSTGDFHESLNFASVHKVPLLFLIENNNYAFSTPTINQYNCESLADRAKGYGIEGISIDGTNAWEVYSAVFDAMQKMSEDGLPRIIESRTLRLEGHAVYDNAEYVDRDLLKKWWAEDPLLKVKNELTASGVTSSSLASFEEEINEYVEKVTIESLKAPRPNAQKQNWSVYSKLKSDFKAPATFKASKVRNLHAINSALDYILKHNEKAFLCGQDIGVYGSAFKTCKGLINKYGPQRVIDTPICESATAGFCLGASQVGAYPIMEFQFADFSTEAVTQIGLNAGTWFFRSEAAAPLLFRLPCGGGVTLGAFHSGEFDGLWSRFPGLKLFYPVTPQETFEALIAGFYDPNPCIIFEHKLLYWGRQGDIDFDGNIESIFRPRKYTDGNDLTIIATGAMVESVLAAVSKNGYSVQVWNPFILNPLEFDQIIEDVKKTGKVLVVQESGETAGLGDRFISLICRECFSELKCAPQIISAPDIPVPFAKELESFYIPSQDKICQKIELMIGEKCE
ncbi:MAG: thiamine pyrophosphate-dependent enzyme [Fibrobacter sp.]|nr:thiamine pyrophosphate-dependent enzyme [Fibrobacter sp.]